MNIIESQLHEFKIALQMHAEEYELTLPDDTVERLAEYFSLLTSWNERLHLVAFRSPPEFATRHVLESLMLLQYLPTGSRIADVGSGGGLPAIPCVLARPDLHAILVEASKRKATFLREVVQQANIKSRVSIVPERFESIATPDVEVVTSRALERFESMLPRLISWSPLKATLLLFGGTALGEAIGDIGLSRTRILMPNSERRYLFVLKRN